jgi:hypothetical protein
MLIISAIDVLLCAFTATITLFFLGGMLASQEREGAGWPGVYGFTHLSESDLHMSTEFPHDNIDGEVGIRLNESPDTGSPARFSLNRQAGPSEGLGNGCNPHRRLDRVR